MEVENQLYVDTRGNGLGQAAPDRPNYTPPTPQQQHDSNCGQTKGYATSASPYYTAPSGAGYAGVQYDVGYGAAPYDLCPTQQPQQMTVVSSNQSSPPADDDDENLDEPGETFDSTLLGGAVLYSCMVFCFCNFIFGLFGYLLASKYKQRSNAFSIFIIVNFTAV